MIQDYEAGKRYIKDFALLQFDRVVKGARVIATWAIGGTVWLEDDAPGRYVLRDTGQSVWDVQL